MSPDEIDTLCLDLGTMMDDDAPAAVEIPKPAEPPHRRQGDKDQRFGYT